MPNAAVYKTYEISDEEMAEVQNKHTYHPPDAGQINKYPLIRAKAKEFELLIRELVPPGRSRAVAITNLENATFWANAGIARDE